MQTRTDHYDKVSGGRLEGMGVTYRAAGLAILVALGATLAGEL